jgi:hypothetical protein
LQQRGSALDLDTSRANGQSIDYDNGSQLKTIQTDENIYYQQQMVSLMFFFSLIPLKFLIL